MPVPGDPPVMLTGDVMPKLNVGGSEAPAGLVVRAAVKVTPPVKPPLGVTVIVEVLPVAAPGELMVMAPPLVRANDAGAAVTVAVTVVVCVIVPEMPVTVTV
jgi:hypothetical protein